MAILTNDKAASSVIGVELKSGFQSTFEETNGNVYLINVGGLHAGNVPSGHLQMFRRSMLLWRCSGAAVD